ncbi:MAG: thioredoxin domain-containing protein [Bacteroidales bacterium]|nr:thioredoxin domain-containing protein [Bacteroidales bacterium]
MNNRIVIKMVFGALFLAAAMTLSAQTEKKPEMLTKETFLEKVWDFDKNPTEFVYKGDKPCVIDFYADWCGPCRKIAPYMEEFMKTYSGEIYVYKINTDQQKELAAMFQARNIPMVLFVPMKGQPQKTVGAYPKEQYQQMIETILLGKPAAQ